MNEQIIKDRCTDMLRRARADSGLSQEQAAAVIGVTKSTIQHWENGESWPNMPTTFLYLLGLGHSVFPYFLDLVYNHEATDSNEDDKVLQDLQSAIKFLPSDSRKKLLYLLAGNHSTAPVAIIEMSCAFTHTSIDKRANTCQSVTTSYEISEATGDLLDPDGIRPNVRVLHAIIDASIEAAKTKSKTYTIMDREVISNEAKTGNEKERKR